MVRIVVKLGRDRDRCGILTIEDEIGTNLLGPFPVAARSSDALSARHHNKSRDPEFRYGDTPVGQYRLTQTIPSPDHTRFGPGMIVLEPASGSAALAEANGRARFFIQGGRSGPDGLLRSTGGALRLSDAHLQTVIGFLGQANGKVACVISEVEGLSGEAVYLDPSCNEEDPPLLNGLEVTTNYIPGVVSRRDVLRTSTMGAVGLMALNLSVSFVSMNALFPSRAYAETAYGEPEQPSQPQPLSPEDQSELKDAPNNGGGTLEPFSPNVPAQTLEPAGPSGAAPANGAFQQLDNMTNGNTTHDQGFDNGQGGPTVTVQPSTTTIPSASPVEPSLPPEQQQILQQDQTYQGYVSQQSSAEKSATDAAAKSQQIQSQINSAPDAATKSKLQVDLVHSRNQESAAQSAARAAKMNADAEKAKVIKRGAPKLEN